MSVTPDRFRLVFVGIMAFVMGLVMSFVMTFVNFSETDLGLFFKAWGKSFVIGTAVAYPVALLTIPFAQAVSQWLTRKNSK